MVPYLKGIYLSINSSRQGRDVDGWTNQKCKRGNQKVNVKPDGNATKCVSTVSRLRLDLEVLMELTCFEGPPQIPVRPTNSKATYIVGDASGSGFGSTSWKTGEEKIHTPYGAWTGEVTKHKFSNFHETANLVLRLRYDQRRESRTGI